MKNLIIITGTLILGLFIFNMMVGDDEHSLKNESAKIMENCAEEYLQ